MQRGYVFFPKVLLVGACLVWSSSGDAQPSAPAAASTPIDTAAKASPSPAPTPIVFSPLTLGDLKRLQQAALSSDYAYRQVAHLANNIGPRLSGSAQAAKAVEICGR
jgi:hypothetical protein